MVIKNPCHCRQESYWPSSLIISFPDGLTIIPWATNCYSGRLFKFIEKRRHYKWNSVRVFFILNLFPHRL